MSEGQSSSSSYPEPPRAGNQPPSPPPGSDYGSPPPSGSGYGSQPPSGSGYGAPTPGVPQGYGGYGPPSSGGSQLSPQDERLWAMLSHLGGIVLWFIAPLVVMLTQGERSPFVRKQAVEALNFQITLTIGYLVSVVLFFVLIGVFLMIAVGLVGLVLMIIAGVKANSGEDYRYPINIRLVS